MKISQIFKWALIAIYLNLWEIFFKMICMQVCHRQECDYCLIIVFLSRNCAIFFATTAQCTCKCFWIFSWSVTVDCWHCFWLNCVCETQRDNMWDVGPQKKSARGKEGRKRKQSFYQRHNRFIFFFTPQLQISIF